MNRSVKGAVGVDVERARSTQIQSNERSVVTGLGLHCLAYYTMGVEREFALQF